MSKARKGLLLSLLTLVIAFAVTATSTYAWFVVNTEVTASNMQVTVRSDTTYLVITSAASAPANVDAIGTNDTASLTAKNNQVLPVRYNESSAGAIKWEIGRGQAYNNGEVTVDNSSQPEYTAISSADVTAEKYFVKYTFYVGLTSTTALPATNLRVKSMTVTANSTENDADTYLPAVSAVVNYGSTYIDYEDISTIGQEVSSVQRDDFDDYAVLSATVAKDTVYAIDVYVYINGDNSVVKSSNGSKLGAFKLAITLECTPGVYSGS